MKATIFLVFAFFITFLCSAQISAITETGDEVLLNDDGTWSYVNKSADDAEVVEIKTNPQPFEKNESATFSLKSKKHNMGFWVDPKKWTFEKGVSNPDAEYEFTLKGEDLYGMVISEKMEIPLTTLRELALENGKIAAPDLKIVKEEYRIVNGLNVLLLQLDGTMQGIKFSYYGYYYSNPSGTVQFITYTSQSLLDHYKKDAESLLNGLVEIK